MSCPSRPARLRAALGVVVLASTAAFAGSAAAVPGPATFTLADHGDPYAANLPYLVSADTCAVKIEAIGASGGDFTFPGQPSADRNGRGATVSTTLAVTPGETLHVNVGGMGAAATPHAFPPRNDPGGSEPVGGGANGGGAGHSAWWVNAAYIGGGGGGGAAGGTRRSRRLGIAVVGGAGDGGYPNGADSLAATGGTQTAGGDGLAADGLVGTAGTLGRGADVAGGLQAPGAGGGGGYYGGGARTFARGRVASNFVGDGGGGSSYVDLAGTDVVHGVATDTGDGSATITAVACPPPPPTTTPPPPPAPTTARLVIRKNGPARAKSGSFIGYKIIVRNPTKVVAKGVVVRDVIPGKLSFAAAVMGARSTTRRNRRVSNRKFTVGNNTISWNLGILQPGQRKVITVRMRVAGTATGKITNRARANASNASLVRAKRVTRVRPRLDAVLPAVTG